MAKLIEDWIEQSVLVGWGHLTEDACHLDKSFSKLCMHLSHLVHTKKSKLQKLTNFQIEQTHKKLKYILEFYSRNENGRDSEVHSLFEKPFT